MANSSFILHEKHVVGSSWFAIYQSWIVKINGENASDNALKMVNVGRLAIFFQYMTKTIFKNKKNGGIILCACIKVLQAVMVGSLGYYRNTRILLTYDLI